MNMRIVYNTIGLCIILCLCFACSLKEDAFVAQTNEGILQLNAAVEDFSVHNVSTKASDTDINELTMLIFTSDGDIVGRPVNIPGSNPTFLVDTKEGYIWDPNATGDAQRIKMDNGDENLHYCDIYMVANSWTTLENYIGYLTTPTVDEDGKVIKAIDKFKAISIPVTSDINVPEGGFPMIGKQAEGITFDLAKNKLSSSTNGSTLATITMKKLYAKVNFRIQVIADQVVATPTFNFTSWQVFNIPGSVSLGEPVVGTSSPAESYFDMATSSTILTAGDKNVEHTVSGSDYLEFSFYMPEHYLYADKTITYPTAMPVENKQRYKPLLCSDALHPTYVKVKGSYKDHQGNAKAVTYNVYLGQDAVSDFCVRRNQLLNNIVTIKGVTDSNPYYNEDGELSYPDGYNTTEDNVSIDHRVEIGSEGFVISMEREAVMDSHFEVRPMDIVVSDRAKIEVTIDDASNTDPNKEIWMRFEESGTSNDHIKDVGVRKYFTTNLVTETLSNDKNKTLEIKEDTRLWLYFDENTNVYDRYLDTDEANPLPKWRDIKLKVNYYAPGNETSKPDKQMVYTFRQWHLWRIRDKDNTRYYDIEHEEEYLYNYASDDNYGKTTDGMAWGLNGLQLSDTDVAFVVDSKLDSDRIREWLTKNAGAENYKYDFYITESESKSKDYSDKDGDGNTDEKFYHPYNGLEFTKKIIDKAISTTNSNGQPYAIANRMLNDDAESAVEYCYNKNKRNSSDGKVPNEFQWYLPATDEIEHIVSGGFGEFEVFQNKFYWSSQPAYTLKKWTGTLWVLITTLTYNGELNVDNLNYARASKVLQDGVTPVPSGMSNPNETLDFGSLSSNNTPTPKFETHTPTYEDGYLPRDLSVGKDAVNRIRCVYRSGLISSLPTSEQEPNK